MIKEILKEAKWIDKTRIAVVKKTNQYQVSERKHPQIKMTKKFEGTKEECVKYIKRNYRNIKQHSFFDDSSFYKGNGAYYTNAKGLEISISPS